MLIGALLLRRLQTHTSFTNHELLIGSSLLILLFFTFFALATSPLWLGVWILVGSIFYTTLEVLVNVCVLLVSPQEDAEFWLLVVHGVFGVGGLLGPLGVVVFGYASFFFFGLFVAMCSLLYILLPSPLPR